MEILPYLSPLPPYRRSPDSFVDRNPNLCYLLISGRHSVMIDTCSDVATVLQELQKRNLRLETLLITHYHGDHTFALTEWLKHFPSLTVGIHPASLQALAASGIKETQLLALRDGMVIPVGEESLRVIAAPGHTSDSLCFWDERGNNLMTGDVIFGGNIGCSDYDRGGNRNIFYRTIVTLLKMLPPSTLLFPGHRSEHYQTLPPYPLEEEKTKNPYVANALSGKRGNFDRALKYFSLEFESAVVVMLDETSLDVITQMEEEIWIPQLQAPREVIRERLKNGHRLLTLRTGQNFPGMVGWCYSPFTIKDDPAGFPRNFEEFSHCTSCCPDNARSAFIYNVGVRPDHRRRGTGSLMLQETFEKIRQDGISEVFIDSRMASYNGSAQHAQEKVPLNDPFQRAVDRYFSTGVLPDADVMALDPAVSFYLKNGLSPWIIRPDFIPDAPSGNMRVICYMNLNQDNPL